MTYLIDTDWVIDHLNHIKHVTRRLEELAPEGPALSIITVGLQQRREDPQPRLPGS